MPKPPSSEEKKVQLISIVITLFLLLGLGSGLILIEIEQDLRQQAKIGRPDINELLIAEEMGELESPAAGTLIKTSQDLNEFSSENSRYQIRYNPNLWQIQPVPARAAASDEDQSYFIHRSMRGFISIYLNSQEFSQLEIEYENLEDLAQQLEDKYINAQFSNFRGQTTVYQDYELVNIGGRNAIKYNYETSAFNQSIPFSEYVLAAGDVLLEAEVKTTGFINFESSLNQFFQELSFPDFEQNPQKSAVKGVQFFENPAVETMSRSFNETQLVVLADPSVVEIIYLYCKELRVNNTGASYLKDSYQYCGGGTGSGFIVGDEGLVATNGHVVHTHPEMDIVGGILTGNAATYDFLTDTILENLNTQGIDVTEQEAGEILSEIMQDPAAIDALIVVLYDLFDRNSIEVVDANSRIYVNVGKKAFEINQSFQELNNSNIDQIIKSGPTVLTAEIVDLDFYNPLAKEVLLEEVQPEGSDIALIKLNVDQSYQFPALNLAKDQTTSTGDKILVISFPGLLSGMGENSAFLIDHQASGSQATITTGLISSFKTDRAGNRLIQTDTAISHGSSGGPALNFNGEVIGIATYGLTDDVSSYNFLIDVESLFELAEQNNISLNRQPRKTYHNWEQGLHFFWDSRYTRSLEQLSTVERHYPIHPTVGDYVVQAEAAIEAGQDVDLIFGIDRQYVYLGLTGFGLLLLIALVFTTFKILKKKSGQKTDFQELSEVDIKDTGQVSQLNQNELKQPEPAPHGYQAQTEIKNQADSNEYDSDEQAA